MRNEKRNCEVILQFLLVGSPAIGIIGTEWRSDHLLTVSIHNVQVGLEYSSNVWKMLSGCNAVSSSIIMSARAQYVLPSRVPSSSYA